MGRITETVLYELYFDLWGMKPAWINTICDKFLDFAEPSKDEICEAELRLLEQELITSLNAFFGEQRLMKATELRIREQERKEK